MFRLIKSVIPNFIKYPLWFFLKSPQRKISKATIGNDLNGIFIYLWYLIFPFKKLQKITVCTGIYNRSNHYLDYLIESLNKANNKHLIEISVFDCNSNDVPNLKAAIEKKWKGKLVFASEPIPFSRAYSFNKAVLQSTSSIVFICDADLWLPKNIVAYCNFYTSQKRVWYPIFFFLFKNKPALVSKENGVWEQYGSKGMLACLKDDWLKIGGLNEKYKTWGDEDTELWERFHQNKFIVIRNRTKIFHHWHNSFNPKYQFMND